MVRKLKLGFEKDLAQWFTKKTDQFTLEPGRAMKSMDLESICSAEATVTGTYTEGSFETINTQVMEYTSTNRDMSMMGTGRRTERRALDE